MATVPRLDHRTTARAALALPLLLVLASAGAAGTVARAQGQEEEFGGTRYFRAPLTREARTLAEEAEASIAASRWDEAARALHALASRHRAEVLPRSFASARSQTALMPGAAAWAAERLASLPDAALDAWLARYEEEARAALVEARRRGGRRELVECARSYPLTAAGTEALYALGDIELERGSPDDALAAWRRAAASARRLGLDPAPGERRIAGADGGDRREGPPRRSDGTHRAGFSLPGPDEGGGPIPMRDADPWVIDGRSIDFEPFDRQVRLEGYNLFPVLAGDRLVLSSTLRVYAVDAYAPEVLWSAGPPVGWSRLGASKRHNLFEGIDYRHNLIAPAVGGGVAVAALQIPYAHLPDENYQGITITKPIPERRLYAFDLETGEELWNHAPPLTWDSGGDSFSWDGETGTYPQRMLVAGSPVVAGTRVLVPCYRMRGRIDLQVACYDLFTGERLWSTSIVSGQRELNMFGRHVEEYAAPPVAVEGRRVVVLTQLGTVAALDLFDGGILWETEYEQIPLPETTSWSPPRRDVVWSNAPPAIAGGAVVVAPLDSFDVLGLDLANGAVLWAYGYGQLPAVQHSSEMRLPYYDVLLGADDDAIYLGGNCVTKLRKPGGLAERRPFFRAEWTHWLEDETRQRRLPRPVLTEDEVLVPTLDARVALVRDGGAEATPKAVPWTESERGNAVVGEGMLFLLGNQSLRGFFDWDVLLERAGAALAARPDDPEARRGHASLLLRRARALEAEGAGRDALALLDEARTSLAPLLDGSRPRDPAASAVLFRCLRAEADVRAGLADGSGALAALRAALPLAPRPVDVRDVLFAQEDVLRERDRERWRAVLAELEERCGDLPTPATVLGRSNEWLVGESLLRIDVPGERVEIPVGLWVLLARANASARHGDTRAALADLHAAIARYGERPIDYGLDVRDVAIERIDRRLELDGAEAYAPFEQRADELLRSAREENDAELLASVTRLYPRAEAAREAARLALEWAFERGDPARTAELVHVAMTGARVPDAGDARALLRLGEVLARRGNEAFARGLLAALVRDGLGDVESDLPAHGGRTIAELAAGSEERSSAAAVPAAHFGAGLVFTGAGRDGAHDWRGIVPDRSHDPEEAPVSTAVLSRAGELVGYASTAPDQPAWTVPLESEPPEECVVLAPGLVLAAAGETVVAVEARTGDRIWERSLGARVSALALGDGVLVAVAGGDAAPRAAGSRAVALDVEGGTRLWELPLGDRPQWWPLVGEGRLVLLNKRYHLDARARVVDLFRGVTLAHFELDRDVDARPHRSAWLESGRLAVPVFSSSRGGPSHLTVYDLERGDEEWRHALPEGREIHSIVASEGRTYVLELPVSFRSQGQGGEIAELDVRTRARRRVAELRPGDEPLGIPPRRRTVLAEPFVFVASAGESTAVRMVHLSHGAVSWTYYIPWPTEELDRSARPRPALSSDVVVIPFATRSRATRQREATYLEIVDRNGGFKRDRQIVPKDLASSDFELHELGSALLVVGTRPGGRLTVMEGSR